MAQSLRDRLNPVKKSPKISHCERSEAISSLKARLLRRARNDEVYGRGAATLCEVARRDETFSTMPLKSIVCG